mmetsp:Transcript_10750/g.12079  ORF Transcript_10750/g.12079 Transcript_10750/m.12079 type:complete len:234 (+) Transcript_10750:53-754(+)
MLSLENRLNTLEDECEILILFVKGGTLERSSRNKFSLSITQPIKSMTNEDVFKIEDSEVYPSVMIDSTQTPTVMKPIDLKIGTKPKKSMTANQDKFNSASKQDVENLTEPVIGVKFSQTPKTKSNKKFDFSIVSSEPYQNPAVVSTTRHTRVDSAGSKSKYFEGPNEHVRIFNTKKIVPTNKASLRFKEVFMLKYSPYAEQSAKIFSISLLEHFKNEFHIVGNERTFSVDQFD